MKIAVITDIHLNKTVYKVMDRNVPDLPFRNVDFIKAFQYTVDTCINHIKPDLFVIGGDIYDKCYYPSNIVRGIFSAELSKLTSAQIPVIILVGNHDISLKTHALKDIGELKLKNIKVIDKSAILTYKDTQLFLFPYSLEVEQKVKTIKEDFLDFVKEIHAKKNDKPSIFFGHFGVSGAAINEYSGDDEIDVVTDTNTTTTLPKKEYKNRSINDINCDDLDSIGSDYVLLGDYHKHQILQTKKCISMYPGSLEKTSFSEIDQKKGFVVYDSEVEAIKSYGKCRFIEYPNCRPMLEFRGNLIEMQNKFKKVDHLKYQESIVKLMFTGLLSEYIDFSAGLETFKKEIREKLDPIHIDVINKAKDDKQDQEATKLVQDIMENGHLSNDDVKDVVKEVIKEQVKDEKEMTLMIDLNDEIYTETVGK